MWRCSARPRRTGSDGCLNCRMESRRTTHSVGYLRGWDPVQFEECFEEWVQAVNEVTGGQVVAIDGKTLRRSHNRAAGKSAIHMVSAWASANRLILGQTKVDDHSNEITAIPELLRTLDVSGCTVTIDAMGCQKEIATTITDQGADYVLALKQNQPQLYDDVTEMF